MTGCYFSLEQDHNLNQGRWLRCLNALASMNRESTRKQVQLATLALFPRAASSHFVLVPRLSSGTKHQSTVELALQGACNWSMSYTSSLAAFLGGEADCWPVILYQIMTMIIYRYFQRQPEFFLSLTVLSYLLRWLSLYLRYLNTQYQPTTEQTVRQPPEKENDTSFRWKSQSLVLHLYS